MSSVLLDLRSWCKDVSLVNPGDTSPSTAKILRLRPIEI